MIGAPGYVKVHRSLLDWEWYGDDATVRVFLHLLLTANWEEKRWRGEVIKPGQQITSMEAIALKLELSRATVRRCLEKLKGTGEVAIQTNNHWTAITLVNWAKYQGDDQPTSQPNANQRPTDATTSGRPMQQPAATTKEEKKLRREEGKNLSPNGERAHANSIEERKRAFIEACKAVVDSDPARLVQSERKGFFAYWTEANTKGKMRFEGERFFDHARRMDTWMQNAERRSGNGFSTVGASKYGREQAEAEMRAIRIANGRDPNGGAVMDDECSRDLLIYRGVIKPDPR